MASVSALLLDLDGVIFTHPAAHALVARRADAFVRREIPGVDASGAVALNRHLYATHGHTLLGLREATGVRIPVASFNAFVYCDRTLGRVAAMDVPSATRARAREVRLLADRASKRGVPAFVFTNAPEVWCDHVLGLLDLRDLFRPASLITSDRVSGMCGGDLVLKPARRSYDAAEAIAVAAFVGLGSPPVAPESVAITFVDDAHQNLASSPGRWTRYLLHEPFAEKGLPPLGGIIPIESMGEVFL